MESLSRRVGVVLIGLLLVGYAQAWGADWKYCTSSEFGDYYYDVGSVKGLPNNIAHVWTQEISSPKGGMDVVSRLGREYIDLKYINTLWEVDCIGKRSRVLSVVYYSKSRSMISSAHNPSAEWNLIVPDPMLEFLSKVVCK